MSSVALGVCELGSGLYGVFQVVRGKTDNARRELPMSARVKEILERRWQSAGSPTEGWIFPAPTKSDHIEPPTLKKAHAKALKESKVRRFVLYDLRHTSLVNLPVSGALDGCPNRGPRVSRSACNTCILTRWNARLGGLMCRAARFANPAAGQAR
jgi:hypothetical protein